MKYSISHPPNLCQICGTEVVPSRLHVTATLNRVVKLGTMTYGGMTCYLGDVVMAATPGSKYKFLSPDSLNVKFFFKKGLQKKCD